MSRALTAVEQDVVDSWRAMEGKYLYTVANPYIAVQTDVERAAKCAVRLASADLGIAEPHLFWFEHQRHFTAAKCIDLNVAYFRSNTNLLGRASPALKVVAVRADLGELDAFETAAHEVFHISRPFDKDDEDDAEAYGRKLLAFARKFAVVRAEPSIYYDSNVSPRDGFKRGDVWVGKGRSGERRARVNTGRRNYPNWVPIT